MDPGITFAELLQYNAIETQRWKDWFATHQEALDRPCDIGMASTVRGFLLHILTTELFFANEVLDLTQPDWKQLPSHTLDQIFDIGDGAHGKFLEFLAKADAEQWALIKDLGVPGLIASKRKMVTQAILHGVHHRAQLATFLRQQGFDGLWMHDLILTRALP